MILRLRSGRLFLNRYLLLITSLYLASACMPRPTPTPFIPPTAQPQLVEPTLIIQPTTPAQIIAVQTTPLPTIVIPTSTTDPGDCVNNLTFLEDLTVPDGTFFPYGATVDKQWRVQNSGTCNWDGRYQLVYVGGAQLGAPERLALYPARSGTQAVIQITFIAPFTDGEYASAWQAFNPNGLAFGDAFYLRITVGAP